MDCMVSSRAILDRGLECGFKNGIVHEVRVCGSNGMCVLELEWPHETQEYPAGFAFCYEGSHAQSQLCYEAGNEQ